MQELANKKIVVSFIQFLWGYFGAEQPGTNKQPPTAVRGAGMRVRNRRFSGCSKKASTRLTSSAPKRMEGISLSGLGNQKDG